MRLRNGTKCSIHSTSNGFLDGLNCTVVGISNFFGDELPGNIYIVKTGSQTPDGYECFCLSESCLTVLPT